MTRFPLISLLVGLSLTVACAPDETVVETLTVDDGSNDGSSDDGSDDGSNDDGDGEDIAIDADLDGYSTLLDCNDADASVNPGMPEVCDGIDNDCSGEIDDGLPIVESYLDEDGDGYGTGDVVQTCGLEGYATQDGDCNDANADIHPGAEDPTGDGIDSNCDDGLDNGETDPGTDDGDTGGDTGETDLVDADADGSYSDVDCDDSDATIYPGATEVEDSLDNDCDGEIDEDCEVPAEDADSDGYSTVSDCDDSDTDVNPGATEICGNGVDDDCSGGDADCSEPDADADGSTADVDCDDADASVYPGAIEIAYDGIDQDCDGSDLDDVDGDGYVYGDDCDDSDADVNPDADETDFGIDGEDNDCDSAVDEDWQAKVIAEYPSSSYYVLNASFYTSGATPNALGWQESDTESSGTTTSVDFLTEDYGDMSGACGLIININVGNPATDWYCVEWAIDESVALDVWHDGVWYDESDVVEWIADNSSGSCAAVVQTNPSSSCTPINDTDE
ncbi:hypothetical protein COV05_00235 [Candidatus Uhrbacteria bacterium CG10_big_fil_rev_8_21_14_0_10_48_16]|uniref:Uncharacterized protein n=1 Tax=Candidatus Uhrbacteria bacterium CG10_big_fil_rev_8_21_14_0_10_48_16 TaxID=1975038 RepID=A0A2M8LIN4_9BACT|nr:MAG: hypothetical protein COV05_00235 [Candidatus Uhrbacteria bacterium CG10_big_fil_rev_8_21_14_0_10_48_16]